MNTLSIVSIIIYTCFFIGAWHIITAERKTVLNLSAFAVLISLGWWSFCNSFFYSAATIESAWFWHKLSSIGWCSFVAFTAYYFLALTNYNKKRLQWWKQALFFAPSVLLIIANLFCKTTSLAQNIVHSTSGWGLTYENSIDSPSLWAYLSYVALYFGFTFFILHKWSKAVRHKMKKTMAIAFIVIDAITIIFGLVTDVVFPLTTPLIPALASVATALFGIGYYAIIYRNDVFNINLMISSDDILKTSNNPIFVVDENTEILKYNIAAANLLGFNKTELIGRNFSDLMATPLDFDLVSPFVGMTNIQSKMNRRDGIVRDVLISANEADDSRHDFLCMIISCQDITKQIKVQNELNLQQERYKKLADDYQTLAHFDSLTGLPNRRYFFDTLNNFEHLYHTQGKDFAVLFLDLDNFKEINDLYGHKTGDELLIATSAKLNTCIKKEEFLARLGGDEFMIIMTFLDSDCIQDKLQIIDAEFQKRICLKQMTCEIKLSIGFAVFSQIGNITKLMQVADEKMYDAKQKKKNKAKI